MPPAFVQTEICLGQVRNRYLKQEAGRYAGNPTFHRF
jgi:hypothetical protein